jgi:hypothetical protein
MLPLLTFLLAMAGCSLLYLSHRNQAWLPRPLPARLTRALGGLGLGLALLCAGLSFSPLTALLVWLALLMLGLGLLPFLSLLRRPHD